MPEAIFSKLAKISVEIGNVLTLDLQTNTWGIQVKVFGNDSFVNVPLFRGNELTALGDVQKAFIQNVIDTFIKDAINTKTGMVLTVAEIRAAGLGYKIDAEAPAVSE